MKNRRPSPNPLSLPGRKPGSVAVMGGTVVDVIFPHVPRLPAWPRHLESTPRNLVRLAEPPIVTLGGNGANAAYVAARCGARVALHTAIADDVLGGLALGWLKGAGCRVLTPASVRATAINVVAANARHERAMLFYPGASGAGSGPAGTNPRASHLLVCGWPHPPIAALERIFREAKARGTFTALDAGPLLDRPWTLGELRRVFDQLDLLLANEYELTRIARTPRLATALAHVRRCFAGNIVVKRGANGAWWIPAGSPTPRSASSTRARVINTVGAGDSFNGALLASLASGQDWPHALDRACAVAASVVASKRGVLGVEPNPRRRNRSKSFP